VARSRWLVLLVAALLLLLGGANRGRVPAYEREGSRTGDQPAARSIRFLTADTDERDDDRSTSCADGDGIARARPWATTPRELTLAASRPAVAQSHVSRVDLRAASPRGPPTFA
jgi:hypothetical protein